MASATKVAALVTTYRVLVTAFPQEEHLWTWAIAVIACVSLAWGNIGALVQLSTLARLGSDWPSVLLVTVGTLVISLAAGRLLQSVLYGVSPTDAVTLLGVTALLALATLVANWLPARRAARVDPLVALRAD